MTMTPQPLRIIRRERENKDTFTLVLTGPDVDLKTKRFTPGQFNMLYTFGVGEVPISFSGDPKLGTIEHTIRDQGMVTRAIGRMRVGDIIGVRGPFGNVWPLEDAEQKDIIILAGGLGLAPLRPVIYHILANRDRFNQVVLFYGARTPGDLLYKTQLTRWRSRFDIEVEVTVDQALDNWRGNVGVITTLTPTTQVRPENTLAMLCGPEIMMRFCVEKLQKLGISLQNIFVSLERNMKCAIGHCGHCQYGPNFICKDGPVFRFNKIDWLFRQREI